MTEAARLRRMLAEDAWRWHLLGLVRSLRLPDCWIGAGFVRSAVWDRLHGREATAPAGDVDVLWFDPARTEPATDAAIEATLRGLAPGVAWSVKNQARMHRRNGDAPYASACDAMRHWPETATAVAARRTGAEDCGIAAPYGLEDLFGGILRPTPGFAGDRLGIVLGRIAAKRWLERWPRLRPVPALTARSG